MSFYGAQKQRAEQQRAAWEAQRQQAQFEEEKRKYKERAQGVADGFYNAAQIAEQIGSE